MMVEEVLTEKIGVVVLGLGNLLRRDEGLGIRSIERLQERFELPEEVQVLDGGTLGLDLLCYLEEAGRLLILDAALTGGPPGSIIRLAGEEVPAFFGMRTSPHEIGLSDLLAVARLKGTEPSEVVVLGMQPEVVELGWELSPPVAGQLDAFTDAVAVELQGWGLVITPKTQEEITGYARGSSNAGSGENSPGADAASRSRWGKQR